MPMHIGRRGSLPGEADTRDELVRTADLALYAAKHGGKNCVVPYSGSLEEKSR